MWLFSLDGMLSVVRHRDHEDMYLVRSRAPGILKRRFPDHPVIRLDDADYRYRVVVSWERLVAEVTGEMLSLLRVGYTNFKDECNKHGDPEYNRSLGLVWGAMHDYQGRLETGGKGTQSHKERRNL